MNTKISVLCVLLALGSAASAHAAYDCSIVAQARGTSNGQPLPDFYPYNIPPAGARVLTLSQVGMSAGTIGGEDFIIESKKVDVSFGSMISYAGEGKGEENFATVVFSRNSKPNRDGIKTEHEKIGTIEIKGAGSRTLLLEDGKYRVTMICAERPENQ